MYLNLHNRGMSQEAVAAPALGVYTMSSAFPEWLATCTARPRSLPQHAWCQDKRTFNGSQITVSTVSTLNGFDCCLQRPLIVHCGEATPDIDLQASRRRLP